LMGRLVHVIDDSLN